MKHLCSEFPRRAPSLKIKEKQLAVWLREELFRCNRLYFTPSSENELADFDTTDLQTGFHSKDFSADRRLVCNALNGLKNFLLLLKDSMRETPPIG